MRTRTVALLIHLGILGAGCAGIVGLGDSPLTLAENDTDGARESAPEPIRDVAAVMPTWCSLQEGSTLCADFDAPDASVAFVPNVSSGDSVAIEGEAGFSPPAALASTLVGSKAGVFLAAQLQTNLPAAAGGMFVLSFALWIDPRCGIAPLDKVFVATITSDQTTFWGPVVYNAGDGGFELRIARFDTLGNYLINIRGIPVLFGEWVNVHYAYCPSNYQDSIATGVSPAACQVPPSGNLPQSVFGIGLRTDSNEQPIGCSVLIDNVRLDEF